MPGSLFKGHTYTFKKEGADLIMLDSSDHSHETITFRDGLIASGSGIIVKGSDNSVGIKGYSHSETDQTFKLVSNFDDGYLELFANTKTFLRAEATLFSTRVLSHKIGQYIGTASSPDSSGGYVNLEFGKNRGDNGGAFIDLIGGTTWTDYALRMIRWSGGQNAGSEIIHRGTGLFKLKNEEAGNMQFSINNAYMNFTANAASKHCFHFENDGNNSNRYLHSWQCGTDNGTGTNWYVYARDGDGTAIGSIRGTNGTFAIFGFTGAHDAKILQSDSKTADIIETGVSDDNYYPLGTIMVNVKSEINNLKDSTDPNVQPSSYIVSSSLHQDKRVLGVYFGNGNDEERPHYNSVAAIGDGVILVNNENGNIENGDYITTTSGSGGYGCKQNDDLLHNYTVAKSLKDVDWSTEPSSSKLIACTYHCG